MKSPKEFKRFVGLGIIILLSSACSSEFMVKNMYEGLGDSFIDDVHEYADFDQHQSQLIETVADDLHHWHRTTQLPIYARVLRDIANASASGALLQRELIRAKLDRIEQAMKNMENAPWPRLDELFSSLSIAQIVQIEETLQDEIVDMERDLKRLHRGNGTEKLIRERRNEMVGLFTDFLDVPLTKAQKSRIQTIATQWQSNPWEELRLETEWNGQFIELLQRLNKRSVSYDAVLEHLLTSSTLLENFAPYQVESNRRLLVDGLHDIFKTMDAEQHARMQASLNRYADLLETL